jgi:hypothetical protein
VIEKVDSGGDDSRLEQVSLLISDAEVRESPEVFAQRFKELRQEL